MALSDAAGDAKAREAAGACTEGRERDVLLFRAAFGEELVDHGEDALGMLVADRLGLPGRNFAVAAQKGRAAPLVRRIKSKNE